jgi:uracil-DNA glycosylase
VDPRVLGADCDHCPLKGLSKPVWGDGDVRRTLAIVGEAPGREEVEAGVPFIGKSGQFVEHVLSLHHVNRREVWLDNAVLCFPPGGDMRAFVQRARREAEKGSFKSPIDCCRPRLFRLLGIPRCGVCGLWGKVPDGPLRCTCPSERRKWTSLKGAQTPRVVLALGNSALEALTGHGGIKAKQLYILGGERSD